MVYKTEDGKIFNTEGDAEKHRDELDRQKAESDSRVRARYADTYHYFKNAGTLFDQGDYDGAIAAYSEAAYSTPNDPVIFNMRGQAYSRKGDYDRAIADHNQALRIHRYKGGTFQVGTAYFLRGYAYSGKGDYDSAIADYNEALKSRYVGVYNLDNNIIRQIYYNLGFAYDKKGQEDLAIENYKNAADYGDKAALENLINRGIKYMRESKNPASVSSGSAGPVSGSARPVSGSARPVSGSARPVSGSARPVKAPKKKIKWPLVILNVFLSIAFGLGMILLIRWGYTLFTGKNLGILLTVIMLLVIIPLYSVIFAFKKVVLIVLLGILSVSGWLMFTGIISKYIDLEKVSSFVSFFQSGASNQSFTVTQDVNFRDNPGTGSNVIRALKAGDTVTVTGDAQNGWIPIEHEGDSGWVSAEFISR